MSSKRAAIRRARRLVGYRGSKANNKRSLLEATWIIHQFQTKMENLAADPPPTVPVSTD